MVTAILGYTLVALVFGVTPGPDVVLAVRYSLAHGVRNGVAVALGAASGSLAWGIAAAVGLSSAVQQAPAVYQSIKLAGAAYLTYLGIQIIIQSRKAGQEGIASKQEATPRSKLAAFRAGFVADLLNPKMGAFYLALIPQFIPPGANVFRWSMLFMLIELAVAIICLSSYAVVANSARHLLQNPRIAAWLDRALGTILIGLAIRVAFE